MQTFRENLRNHLPQLFIIVQLLMFGVSIYHYIFNISSTSLYYMVAFSQGLIIPIGVLLFVIISRHKDEWRIKNISFYLLAIMVISATRTVISIINVLIEMPEYGIPWIGVFVPFVLPLIILILTYRRGILIELFAENSIVIDRLFFTTIFATVLVEFISTQIQLYNYGVTFDSVAEMVLMMRYNIIVIVLIAIPTIMNWVIKDNVTISKHLNTVFPIFIVLVMILIATVKYINSLVHFFSEPDPFTVMGYLGALHLFGVGYMMIFYSVLKIISWKQIVQKTTYIELEGEYSE